MKKRNSKYVFRIQYLGGFADDFNEKEKWYRDFEVCSEITLENLNSIIQKILNWDDSHLYHFAIKGVKYAFLGLDELVVDDFDETLLSCDVSLRELNFAKNEILYYTYDFGDKHRFCLKLLSENNMASGKKPFLICIKGNDISQKPLWIDGIPHIRVNESHPAHILYKEIKYYDNRYYRKQVRFIQ